MNREDVMNFLVEKYNYPENTAKIVSEKLCLASDLIQEAFIEFKDTGTPPDLIIENYSLTKLQQEHGMNVVAALVTLDWLKKEPEKAKLSLQRGYDRVKKK